jgi:hypothetical protein
MTFDTCSCRVHPVVSIHDVAGRDSRSNRGVLGGREGSLTAGGT